MSAAKVTTSNAVFSQLLQKHALVISPGQLNPKVIMQWANTCTAYFRKQKIKSEDQVTEAAMGLQDELVQDWYVNDIDTFNALSFSEFVKQLRACFLPRDWEDIVSTTLCRMFQCDSDHLADWIDSIEKQNLLLCDSTLHMSEKELRTHMLRSDVPRRGRRSRTLRTSNIGRTP